MLIIAHRGANREALENSWEGFEKAIAAGAGRIELDLQLCSDGLAVVMHDATAKRTLGRPEAIAELSSAELARLRLRNGERVPMLSELLARLLPQVELNLEIKGRRPELAAVAAAAVECTGLGAKVIFSCFFPEPMLYLRDHYPQLSRAALWGYDTAAIHLPYFLAPQLMMEAYSCTTIHPQVELVSASFMDQALARQWIVYPWVPMRASEGPSLWQRLRELGVHGLCTNEPRAMAAWQAGLAAPRSRTDTDEP